MPAKPINPDIPWGEGGAANTLNVAELTAPNDHQAVAEVLAGCVMGSFKMMQKDRLPLAWIEKMAIGFMPPDENEEGGLPRAFFVATVRKPEAPE